jgi:hypothetical protein
MLNVHEIPVLCATVTCTSTQKLIGLQNVNTVWRYTAHYN